MNRRADRIESKDAAMIVEKIVSGGQTGADRAGLDFAIQAGIPHGGWCPSGRLAEDGPISAHYDLEETPAEGYSQRTEWNVRDSDGTVIITRAALLTGGSKLTRKFCKKWKRPRLHVSEEATDEPGKALADFIEKNRIRVLNVAGPRESTDAGIGIFVAEVLREGFE